jgi:formiminotetrahydrofolate cyclodeaminase
MTPAAEDSPAVSTETSTVSAWVGRLAEPVPNPGGGAASGVMLSIAAALLSMVAGYTDEPEGERAVELHGLRLRAEALRNDAILLADADAEASRAFGAAYRLPEGRERDDAIRTASVAAAESAAVLGAHAQAAVADVEWLAEWGNPTLIADVAVAATSLRSALSSARTNVGVDLAALLGIGDDRREIEAAHPSLWRAVSDNDTAMARIDSLLAALDARIIPTHL